MECQKPITSESCGVCAYRTNEKQAFREICEQHKRYIEEKERVSEREREERELIANHMNLLLPNNWHN